MSDKPVIAILIGPFPGPLHGVSVINAKLAECMVARGLVPLRIDLSPGQARRGLGYHATRSIRTLWGLVRLLVARFRGRGRAVMSVDGGIGIFYNIVLALLLRLTGQPVLLYHHSTRYVLADSGLIRVLLAVAGPRVPHVFCSREMAFLFGARYGSSGATLIVNNAAWVDPVPTGAGSQSGLRLGFLSTLTQEKGLGRAIETLRLLRGRGLDAQLILAGAATDQAADRMLRDAGAEFGAALTCHGVLRGADKARFYGELDVFLFPSLYPHETQSLVVPEALAAGTPVIAYDHRFVGEVLGEGGYLIPTAQPFAQKALDWIEAGKGEWPQRRIAARQQFETERTDAAGKIDHLMAWVRGEWQQ